MKISRKLTCLAVSALLGCTAKPAASPTALQQRYAAAADPSPPQSPTQAAPWWHQISLPPEELFAGANDTSAVWVDASYRTTPSRTRVGFLNWEMAGPTQPYGNLSTRTVDEFDCSSGRSRLLESAAYASRGGTGDLLHSDTLVSDWHYIEPRTMIAAAAKLICTAPAADAPTARTHARNKHKPAPQRPPPAAPTYI